MNDISLASAESAINSLPDQGGLEQLVKDLLAAAAAQGASSAEAAVSFEAGLAVTVRMGEVETLEHHRDRGIGVTVYFGTRKGSASTADFGSQAIQHTVAAACAIARYTAEDAYAGLAEAERLADDIPNLDLFHPWNVDAEQAIHLAQTCEDAARAADSRITNSEGASVSSHSALRVYGNSHGFLAGFPSTSHSVSCAVIGEQDGAMQRDHWYSVARDHTALEAMHAVGAHAALRTVQRLGAQRLSTRKCPVLFSADMARGLIGHFVSAIRGGNLYRRASFLLDCLDQAVFPDTMRIYEQPHLAKALGSAPFDDEVVATRARDVVTNGILQGYVLDSYAARKLGMQTTGNAGGVHNLTVEPGAQDATALLRTMHNGLLVTELMGQGVNTVTGDYSRGATGFWVENGVIQYPVEEITIAGNLRDMYKHIAAVGNDVDRRGNILTGSLLIEEMTIAGE